MADGQSNPVFSGLDQGLAIAERLNRIEMAKKEAEARSNELALNRYQWLSQNVLKATGAPKELRGSMLEDLQQQAMTAGIPWNSSWTKILQNDKYNDEVRNAFLALGGVKPGSPEELSLAQGAVGAMADPVKAIELAQNLNRQKAQQAELASRERVARAEIKSREGLVQQKTQAEAQAKAEEPTEAEKAADREFGKEYGQFTSTGGFAKADSVISGFQDIIKRAEKVKNLSGPVVGSVPESARKRLYPESFALQQDLETLVQGRMREVLGAQFTAKEGENILRRSFDPALPPQVNIERMKRELANAEEMLKQRVSVMQHYQKNRSLRGLEATQFAQSGSGAGQNVAQGQGISQGGGNKAPSQEMAQRWFSNQPESVQQALTEQGIRPDAPDFLAKLTELNRSMNQSNVAVSVPGGQ